VSEQNVELHRRVVEALNARDVEALIALCDPNAELHSALAAVGGAVYHGHDGLRTWQREIDDAFEAIRAEPEAFFDLTGHTLAFYVQRVRGRHSGAEVAMPAAQVARWHNGLCVYFKVYARREDALRDLGVSEDALEPITP
jgi:hypothetical protein